MKKVIFTLALAVGFTVAAYSQNYNSAIGLRFGYPTSISYKKFISEPGAIEVFAGLRSYPFYSWFNVGGLYQHHWQLPTVADGLSWYAGGGVSVFFWNYDDGYAGGNTSIGILGTLGLDYKFENTPLNISLDWLPIFSFHNTYNKGFGGAYGGLSVRYVIN